MKPPKNAKIFKNPTSIFWLDEDGILCAISKKAPAQTLKSTKKSLEDLRKIVGKEKICLLIDVTHSSESTRETREFAAEELPKLVKAIAMVSDSALGRMLANLFFSIKSQPYPTKMFKEEKEAKEWLNQYI